MIVILLVLILLTLIFKDKFLALATLAMFLLVVVTSLLMH